MQCLNMFQEDLNDYVAMPKPNMYQSLHTTIITGDGHIFEIQIRTHEMDEVAESGIAAHWRYKEGLHYDAKQEQAEIEEQLHWLRDFVSISNESTDSTAREYVDFICMIYLMQMYMSYSKRKKLLVYQQDLLR